MDKASKELAQRRAVTMSIAVLVMMIVLTLVELLAVVGVAVLWARGNRARAKLGMNPRGSLLFMLVWVGVFVIVGWIAVLQTGWALIPLLIAAAIYSILKSVLPFSDFPGVYDKDWKPVKSPCGWKSDGGGIVHYPGHGSWDTTSRGLLENRAFKSGQTTYYVKRTVYGYDVTMPLEITGLPGYWSEFDEAVVREETLLELLMEEQLTARPLSPDEGREVCIDHLWGVLRDVIGEFLAAERPDDVQVRLKQPTIRPPAVRRDLV